eukprot:3939780-Rhodomonas_salina.1
MQSSEVTFHEQSLDGFAGVDSQTDRGTGEHDDALRRARAFEDIVIESKHIFAEKSLRDDNARCLEATRAAAKKRMQKQHMLRLRFRKDSKSQAALRRMRDEQRAARAAAAAVAVAHKQTDLVDEWMSLMKMKECPATPATSGGIGTVRM